MPNLDDYKTLFDEIPGEKKVETVPYEIWTTSEKDCKEYPYTVMNAIYRVGFVEGYKHAQDLRIEKFRPNGEGLPRLYTIAEAADVLRVTRRTIYNYIESGRLHPVLIGDKLQRITDDDIANLIITGKKAGS